MDHLSLIYVTTYESAGIRFVIKQTRQAVLPVACQNSRVPGQPDDWAPPFHKENEYNLYVICIILYIIILLLYIQQNNLLSVDALGLCAIVIVLFMECNKNKWIKLICHSRPNRFESSIYAKIKSFDLKDVFSRRKIALTEVFEWVI